MPVAIKARRAFACSHCPRVYSRKCHLTKHAEIHDPRTKKFACPWDGCDHRTRQRSNLKTHMKKHTNTKDISCSKCGYATGDPALASRHQQRKHGYIPPATRQCRYTISNVASSPSGSEASLPTTPTTEDKPELDNNWQLYPFENSFTSVQVKPLYPAAEAIPALSYPAFDVETLFSTESGYDWSSPVTNAESPLSSPDVWSSWTPTPSTPSSFGWSDYSVAQSFTPSPEPSTTYLPSPSTPDIEESFEQFFNFVLPDGSWALPPSETVYGSYVPAQLSGSQLSADDAFFNGLYQ